MHKRPDRIRKLGSDQDVSTARDAAIQDAGEHAGTIPDLSTEQPIPTTATMVRTRARAS